MSVLARTIADRLEAFPEAWYHEPGDVLAGEITELAVMDRGYGSYYAVTVVTEAKSTERGGIAISPGSVRTWHAFGAIPKDELKKLQPRVGDQIAAKDLDVRPGKRYRDWRILVEPKTVSSNAAVIDDRNLGAAELIEDKAQLRPDATSADRYSDDERYADMPGMPVANTASFAAGDEIPYR